MKLKIDYMEPRIYIVVPAYNEATRIQSTLKDLLQVLQASVIVVDDGSSDDTYQRAQGKAVVLRHPINRGMGAALRTGTIHALNMGASIIVHFDADGQHLASDISTLLEPLTTDSADIVIGSRYLQPNDIPWSKKWLIHKPALFFQNAVSGMKLTDIHNGLRAMNARAASRITISQDRFAHASEIISEIKRHKLRYTEVPVTISYREYGQGFLAGLKILKEILTHKVIK